MCVCAGILVSVPLCWASFKIMFVNEHRRRCVLMADLPEKCSLWSHPLLSPEKVFTVVLRKRSSHHCLLSVFICFVFEAGSHNAAQEASSSLCSPDCPETYGNPPASVSHALELQAQTIMPSSSCCIAFTQISPIVDMLSFSLNISRISPLFPISSDFRCMHLHMHVLITNKPSFYPSIPCRSISIWFSDKVLLYSPR